MDLAHFVSAVVLQDQIFHLKSQHISSLKLNNVIGGSPVLIEIPVDALNLDGSAGLLTALWDHACAQIGLLKRSADKPGPGREEIEDISTLWRELFGLPTGKLDVFDSEIKNDYDSAGAGLIRKLVESTDHVELSMQVANEDHFGVSELARKQSRLASECNYRYLFNRLLSCATDLPYIPNAFRVPFQRWWYERGLVVEKAFSLSDYIDAQYRVTIAARIGVGPTNMMLPFFLTALLQRISRLEEFGEELARMRHRALPLRRKWADLEAAIKRGDVNQIESLRKDLNGEVVTLTDWLQPTAMFGAGVRS
jgi:hypothetical protein